MPPKSTYKLANCEELRVILGSEATPESDPTHATTIDSGRAPRQLAGRLPE